VEKLGPNTYIYVTVSVYKIAFIVVGRKNTFVTSASASQYTTMVVSFEY